MTAETDPISFRGETLCLRPLAAGDRPLIEDLVARMELDDLRMRFFGGSGTIAPDVLNQLLRIDPQRRIALVASRRASDGTEEILAVARAHELIPGSAELALLVRSDLKGMGLGSVLLERLIARCRRRGYSVLVAEVLQQNARMLRLAGKYGFRRRTETAQFDTTQLVLELDSLAA